MAQTENIEKLLNFEIHFERSGKKILNFAITIICSIILFITWPLTFFNAIAIRISKVQGHYINPKTPYSRYCPYSIASSFLNSRTEFR